MNWTKIIDFGFLSRFFASFSRSLNNPSFSRGGLAVVAILLLHVLASAQTIEGVVLDQAGAAIPGARVAANGAASRAETTTDADGHFIFNVNGERGAVLTVTADGFAVFTRKLGGADEFVTVALAPAAARGDVVVEIGRVETRLADTPASVVALPRESIEFSAAQRIDDVLRQVPGFTQFRRGSSRHSNPTTQGANLRGLAGSGASRANVLFDGFTLNDAFGGWTYWSRVPTVAVEQAEVLRGGASAFYGDQGLSGAVNLRSSRLKGKPILRVDLSAGSQKMFDGSLFGAYGRGAWSGDVAFEQFQTAGYVPAAATERGVVDTRAGSRFRNSILKVQRSFGESKRVFAGGQIFGERRDNGTSRTSNGTYFRRAFAGAEAFGLQLRGFIEKQTYDQTFSAIGANRATETLSRIQRVPSQAFGASAFWSRALGAKNSFSASAELREVRGFSDEIVFANGRATSRVGAGGRQRALGFFAQDVWQASKRLNVSLAARVDRWTNDAALSSTTALATRQTATTVFPRRAETAFSPRAAALFRVTDNLSLVASYARSFRAPTLNELYRAFRVGNVLTLANENLRSETSGNADFGMRISEFGGRISIRGTLFLARVSNPVVSATLSTTPSLITRQRQNVGETRARGAELDAEVAPFDKLRLSAGYLFTDSRVGASGGRVVPQAARHQFTFQALWRPASRLTLSFQSRASGAQFEDDLNTLVLRRYFTADAFASYKFTRVSIYLAVENLADTRFDLGRTPGLTVAAPRSARIGFRF